MIYSQKRINEICEARNIPISQVEQACGFSNGYINTERKREFPTDRLFKILDYLGMSYEEFFNVGTKQTQEIETALTQIKNASQEVYDVIMRKWTIDDEADENDAYSELQSMMDDEDFRNLMDGYKKMRSNPDKVRTMKSFMSFLNEEGNQFAD